MKTDRIRQGIGFSVKLRLRRLAYQCWLLPSSLHRWCFANLPACSPLLERRAIEQPCFLFQEIQLTQRACLAVSGKPRMFSHNFMPRGFQRRRKQTVVVLRVLCACVCRLTTLNKHLAQTLALPHFQECCRHHCMPDSHFLYHSSPFYFLLWYFLFCDMLIGLCPFLFLLCFCFRHNYTLTPYTWAMATPVMSDDGSPEPELLVHLPIVYLYVRSPFKGHRDFRPGLQPPTGMEMPSLSTTGLSGIEIWSPTIRVVQTLENKNHSAKKTSWNTTKPHFSPNT